AGDADEERSTPAWVCHPGNDTVLPGGIPQSIGLVGDGTNAQATHLVEDRPGEHRGGRGGDPEHTARPRLGAAAFGGRRLGGDGDLIEPRLLVAVGGGGTLELGALVCGEGGQIHRRRFGGSRLFDRRLGWFLGEVDLPDQAETVQG